MNTEDDQRPDVELGHEDADGYGATPEQTDAANGRDDALMSAVSAACAAGRLVTSLNLVDADDASNARLHGVNGRLFAAGCGGRGGR